MLTAHQPQTVTLRSILLFKPNAMSCYRLQAMFTVGQAEVKQFLGTRPSEPKTFQHSPAPYSNFPILGGQPARPAPTSGPLTTGLSPPRQPGSVPPTNVSGVPETHFCPSGGCKCRITTSLLYGCAGTCALRLAGRNRKPCRLTP